MWDRIEPLMPADPIRGQPWADHRRTLEAIGFMVAAAPSGALACAAQVFLLVRWGPM